MSIRSIGLDLDGCLYDWHSSIYDYYRKFKNYSGNWRLFWSPEHMLEIEEELKVMINIDIFYSNQLPTKDCISFIDSIKDRFEIFYITSRPGLVKLTTEQYLRRHKFPQRDNLIFTEDKVNMARLLKLSYAIDDLPKHVEALSKVTKVIMIAKPWNECIQDKYTTVKHLTDSLQYMED